MDIQSLSDALVADGFTQCNSPGIGTSSLIKRRRACEMPYVNEHIVGTLGVTDYDTFYVEVDLTEGTVAMGCEAARYYEDAVPIDSDEGLAILRDVGFTPPLVTNCELVRAG